MINAQLSRLGSRLAPRQIHRGSRMHARGDLTLGTGMPGLSGQDRRGFRLGPSLGRCLQILLDALQNQIHVVGIVARRGARSRVGRCSCARCGSADLWCSCSLSQMLQDLAEVGAGAHAVVGWCFGLHFLAGLIVWLWIHRSHCHHRTLFCCRCALPGILGVGHEALHYASVGTLLSLGLSQLGVGLGLAVTLYVLLELHSSVLEPDLHLAFAQGQALSNLNPARPVQVHVALELVLKFHQLDTGEGSPWSLKLHPLRVVVGLRWQILVRWHMLLMHMLRGAVIVEGGGVGVHLVVVGRQTDGVNIVMMTIDQLKAGKQLISLLLIFDFWSEYSHHCI